ncbi:MAG: DNA polymerase III subunit chi [Burkholderiaceae bacterium]|nr:MAG: DNA polymerase III subunit chi [Burkholderiaceae bacterium]
MGICFRILKLTRIDFYYDVKDILSFASRMARKLYYEKVISAKQPLVIRCKDQSHCEEVSYSIQNFSKKDFLPCVQFSDKSADLFPIILSTVSEIPLWADDIIVLLNLDTKIEMTFSSYCRVIEIVDQTELNRQKGRERYKYYKERGYEIFGHRVDK